MTKDQEYKLLFENWKQYVQEQAFDLPKTKTYKPSSKSDVSDEVSFEPPSLPLNDRSKLSDTLKKLGATIDAEDPDFMDTMSKAICGLLSQMGVFMKLESELDNQDETTESSAGGFSGWLLKQVGKAASISGKLLQSMAEFLPGCEGYQELKDKWEDKQKKKKEETSTDSATGTTTTTTTINGKKVKVKIELPICDAEEVSWNKKCWQYHYTENVLDDDTKKKEKIEAAKQKAREYIAKQAKDQAAPGGFDQFWDFLRQTDKDSPKKPDANQDLGDPSKKPGFEKHGKHYYFGRPKKLSIPQIYKLAIGAGFQPKDAFIMTMIALEESMGMTNIHSHTGLKKGDASYGLWQINMLGDLGPDRRKKYNLKSNNDLFKPEINAKIAYDFATNSGKRRPSFTPWGATRKTKEHPEGKHLRHRDRVKKALQESGIKFA